jgi:hypothetical protein
VRVLAVIVCVAVAAGCGDGKGTTKPDNPVPKMDLDAKAQKASGEFNP